MLDCKGVVRIDYMFDRASEQVYITEINTIPGSLAFYLWENKGVKYSQLIDRMVDCARKANEDRNMRNYLILRHFEGCFARRREGHKRGARAANSNTNFLHSPAPSAHSYLIASINTNVKSMKEGKCLRLEDIKSPQGH